MIFPREKKKLWRYASRNNPATCDADGIPTPTQQLQPLHPRHQRHLQMGANSCSYYTDQSAVMRQLNSPPPPYCSIPCSIDCSGTYRLIHCPHQQQHQQHQQQQQQLMYQTNAEEDISASALATEASDCSYIRDGCSYASSAEDMLNDENGACLGPGPGPGPTPAPVPIPMSMPACSKATFAMTAANMFRNCCGGGGSNSTTDSSSGISSKATPNDNKVLSRSRQRSATTPTCPMLPQPPTLSAAGAVVSTTPPHRNRTLHQLFDALLKKLKNKQITELFQAVKSRVDPSHKSDSLSANGTPLSSSLSYLQCILIKCTPPFEEEHHLTTCRLFFWSDLKDAAELRRLPTCPSARENVYMCCNPLHWYRISQPIDSESAPPPYQRSKMQRLKEQDIEDNSQHNERSSGNTWAVQSSSISKKSESQLYMPSLESLTTDGKDRSAVNWCQIAYWELGQRVGELFQARKSAVNIYTDGPADSAGESMCLRALCPKRAPQDTVRNTREKVGLGVTLSLECGDVWVYNRSNVPVFVDSPTLAERLDHVCKVLPGYCLKAFETQRAKWLAGRQSQPTHLGPIDPFSMKLSFAKGWGNMYHRQDIMGCPCWLEVHFSHSR